MAETEGSHNLHESREEDDGVRGGFEGFGDTSLPENYGGTGGCSFDDETAVNGVDDLDKINFKDINVEGVMKYHFPDSDVAFMFYNWSASIHGFAARKSKVMRNRNGDITQQTFLCHREGRREVKLNFGCRKRRPKRTTRCGCQAKCMVHVESNSGRWYIKLFHDVHNHTLLDDKWSGMLPAHRKMTDFDKFQMVCMRNVGIRTSHIYGLFASQAGGYERLGFKKRDMYNVQYRQKRTDTDAQAALEFLEGMRSTDEMMFVEHTVNSDKTLEHIFWAAGVGRCNYTVFGDVLAFDATYKKNKYLCPLVVFSGINHHNQSIIFAGAIVGNETEETYVWLLEQFMAAMGGKSPVSIITDGDLAMRNAIRKVFPNANHRLCAWHLLRNATSNVKNPIFVSRFKQCMLGDYDVEEFQVKWDAMVADFGLQDNDWVSKLFEKRNMWATAHVRGKFFAGFRTTSRCEGLHSEFGKYVTLQNHLLDFLQQYFRWLDYMRYREVEADFMSAHGDDVLLTPFRFIERSAASVYTREVLKVFQTVLIRACSCKVVGVRQTATDFIYTVYRYRRDGLRWSVSFSPATLQFKCSCLRFESLGIPCDHLVSVIFHLDIGKLPECLILKRWTKAAKDTIGLSFVDNSCTRDPGLVSQYFGLVERCKRMATFAVDCGKPELFRKTVTIIEEQTKLLEAACEGDKVPKQKQTTEEAVGNPPKARTKGCGGTQEGNNSMRAPRTCGFCGKQGHNERSCPVVRDASNATMSLRGNPLSDDDDDDENTPLDYVNIDMNVI